MVDSNTLNTSPLGDKAFQPLEAQTLEQAGLSESLVDALICKFLNLLSNAPGRRLAECICLPMRLLEARFQKLKTRHWLTHTGAAPLNDYMYTLTDQGRIQVQIYTEGCAYLGPAPVPLGDYIASVEAQAMSAAVPRQQLEGAFRDISVNGSLLARLGPAVNSGAGLFLYGAPGNGKTTLAERITLCFGQDIWLPKALLADDEIIKLYDPAYHREVTASATNLLRQDSLDKRWIKIRRPTVIVGGELTMSSLEIRHDARTNISEAPLQMKSNGGSLVIDDFGRQRIDPTELLNRWIIPLEKRYDFQTLASGKKIQVPFDQLIVFSTNLEPKELVDEAFLRRIPYKIHVPDPDEAEFRSLFQHCAPAVGCEYDPKAVDHLLDTHYRPTKRPMRRCHPRDLLLQICNYCAYEGLAVTMKPEYLDAAVENYFTVVG